MAHTATSFLERTIWLLASAIAGWLFLCLSYFAYTVMTTPVEHWRSSHQPWSGVRDTLDILLRVYIPAFVLFAIPACYSARLPVSLCKRSLIGGIVFASGGMLWSLYFKGVLGAMLSRSENMDFSMWFYGLIARPLLFFGVFLFAAGAAAFSLLPARRARIETSNQPLQPTAGRCTKRLKDEL